MVTDQRKPQLLSTLGGSPSPLQNRTEQPLLSEGGEGWAWLLGNNGERLTGWSVQKDSRQWERILTGLGKGCHVAFLPPSFPRSSQRFVEGALQLVPAGKSPQAEELPKNSASVSLKLFLKETLAFSFVLLDLHAGKRYHSVLFFTSHCKYWVSVQ